MRRSKPYPASRRNCIAATSNVIVPEITCGCFFVSALSAAWQAFPEDFT